MGVSEPTESARRERIPREAVQRAWAQRGFSCELWVDPPETVWEDFVHDTDELLLLLDGSLLIEFDGRTLRLEPGDELLIPAGTKHTVRNLNGTSVRWLYGYPTNSAAS